MAFLRPMLARLGPIHAYSTASRAAPLIVAFSTAAAKGSASDLIAQHRVEVKEQTDVRRNLTFAFFSGAYLGIGQHYIYNVAFTRMFGPGTDLVTVLKKVVIDATIHVPCIYLPLYYPFETIALGKGTAMDGLARYKADAPAVLSTYWSMWPPVHALSFSVVPQELRIGFVSCVSFVWLIYLSYASHREGEGHAEVIAASEPNHT